MFRSLIDLWSWLSRSLDRQFRSRGAHAAQVEQWPIRILDPATAAVVWSMWMYGKSRARNAVGSWPSFERAVRAAQVCGIVVRGGDPQLHAGRVNPRRFGITRRHDAVLELPKTGPLVENVIEISDEVAKFTVRIVTERRNGSRRPGDLQERHGLPLAMLWALNNPGPESEALFAIRAVRKNGAVAITPPALQVAGYPLIPGRQKQQTTCEDGYGHGYTDDPDPTPDG